MKCSWKEKREILCDLIKAISDQYGGDDPIWLKEYCDDIVNLYRGDLLKAIACFEGLVVK